MPVWVCATATTASVLKLVINQIHWQPNLDIIKLYMSESIIHPTSSELTNEAQIAVTLNDSESQELKMNGSWDSWPQIAYSTSRSR